MNDCIFCKIVSGEIPSHNVYEDADTLAFLDIHPTVVGHVLVVPKEHAESMLGSSDAALAAVMKVVKKIAPAAMAAAETDSFNLGVNTGAQAGQVVMHTHFHILPRRNDDGRRLWGAMEQTPDLTALAEKIRARLGA